MAYYGQDQILLMLVLFLHTLTGPQPSLVHCHEYALEQPETGQKWALAEGLGFSMHVLHLPGLQVSHLETGEKTNRHNASKERLEGTIRDLLRSVKTCILDEVSLSNT